MLAYPHSDFDPNLPQQGLYFPVLTSNKCTTSLGLELYVICNSVPSKKLDSTNFKVNLPLVKDVIFNEYFQQNCGTGLS